MSNYKKITLAIASAVLMLGISACGGQQQAGHDYYYSSNVNPQFTASAPMVHEGVSTGVDNVLRGMNSSGSTGKGKNGNGFSSKAMSGSNDEKKWTGIASNSIPNNESNIKKHSNGTSSHDLMMNGQAMNEQQQQIMNKIRRVQGVNDATVDLNDKQIIVGLDVENIGRREEVVNNVKALLQREYADYEVQVTARRAELDRVHSFNRNNEASELSGASITDDLRALLSNIKESFKKPLR